MSRKIYRYRVGALVTMVIRRTFPYVRSSTFNLFNSVFNLSSLFVIFFTSFPCSSSFSCSSYPPIFHLFHLRSSISHIFHIRLIPVFLVLFFHSSSFSRQILFPHFSFGTSILHIPCFHGLTRTWIIFHTLAGIGLTSPRLHFYTFSAVAAESIDAHFYFPTR